MTTKGIPLMQQQRNSAALPAGASTPTPTSPVRDVERGADQARKPPSPETLELSPEKSLELLVDDPPASVLDDLPPSAPLTFRLGQSAVGLSAWEAVDNCSDNCSTLAAG